MATRAMATSTATGAATGAVADTATDGASGATALAAERARPSRRRGRRAGTFATAGAAALLVACQTVQTTKPGAIGLDRDQRFSSFVSEQEMEAGAATAYAQVLGEARKKGALNTDPAMTRRVRAIADRIIPTVGAFREDAKGWNWQVNVIEEDQLNAWAMPGGKIAFYSGIIEKLELTDAEIAAIMGHEIAHALREHSRERASSQALSGLVLQGGAIVGSVVTGTDLTGLSQVAQTAYQLSVELPNSREHETEADRVGIELMARAGYDPAAAADVWRKMARAGGASGPQFLSTHPSPESRIADLTRYAQVVQPLYRQASSGRTPS